jgi:glycosyltransferase involved in cell wall biosynthesis
LNEIRISVVMATYNGALYVQAQVESLLSCLGSNDEIVVSDDGSSDATLAILRTLPDPRIRILPAGKRLGYQKNFERAILAAKGAFIFFSDQDDICLPKRIRESLAALSNADCVGGDAILVDQDLKILQQSHFAARRSRFSAFWLFVRPSVIGATMACRRDFLLQSLPFPAKVPHDMWLSVRAAWRGRLVIVQQPFILYRRHTAVVSLTGTSRRRGVHMIIKERWLLLCALVLGTGKTNDGPKT